MRQLKKTVQGHLKRRKEEEAFRSHLVTVWFVFGGFLAYQVFFTPGNLTTVVSAGPLIGIGLMLFCLPLIVAVCGTYFIVMFVQGRDNGSALTSFAIVAAYFLLWRGIWWAMYGRRGLLTRPTP